MEFDKKFQNLRCPICDRNLTKLNQITHGTFTCPLEIKNKLNISFSYNSHYESEYSFTNNFTKPVKERIILSFKNKNFENQNYLIEYYGGNIIISKELFGAFGDIRVSIFNKIYEFNNDSSIINLKETSEEIFLEKLETFKTFQ